MSLSQSAIRITPTLWHDGQAANAAEFYVDLFNSSPHASSRPKSQIRQTTHYHPDEVPHCHEFGPGTVLTVSFSLAGNDFMTLNGGPIFKFTPAVSLMVECEDQEEIDHFWNGFVQGNDDRVMNCGWVNDAWGLSWQIVPKYIRQLVELEDRTKYDRLHVWMSKPENMPKKLILKDLIEAVEGSK